MASKVQGVPAGQAGDNKRKRPLTNGDDAAMQISDERFSRFMSNLPGLAWIKDADGRYVFANDAAVKAFGTTRDELYGKTDEELFPPETATAFRENDRRAFKKRTGIQTVETLGVDGETTHSIVSKFPIPGRDGKPALIGGMAIDISQQKRIEEEIRQISRMPAENPSPVMRISAEGEILYANAAARPLLGFWKRTSGLKLPRDFRIRLHEAFRVGLRQDFEIEFDGRTLLATIAPVVEAGYINFYGTDITDRKAVEEALQQKESELQLIADSTPVVLVRCGRDLKYQFINKAGAALFGLEPGDMVGKSVKSLMGKEAFSAVKPYIDRALNGEALEYEAVVAYPAVGKRTMRVNYVPDFDDAGRVTGWIASIIDVTELRLAQAGTARLAAIVESSDDAIISKDLNGVITSWNRGAEHVFGYTADEAIGQPVTMLMPPERVDEEPGILARIRGGESIEHYETIRRRKDGTLLDISLTVSPIRNADGIVIGASKVARDITQRKEAEERLRVSQKRLRLITDSLPALISYVDRDERYVYANHTYKEWFDVDPKDVVGRSVRHIFGISAYRKLKPSIDRALAGREASFEALIPYRAGGPRYVHGIYVPDVGADGRVRGYYGLTSDFTDLKRSQELLRSSEERLALMMETFTDYAIFSTDREGNIDSWNTGAEHIFGYSRDEMIGRNADILFLPEDIAAGVPAREMRHARQRGRASDERWHIRKDGTRFFASGVMMPLYVGKTLTGYAKIAGDLTQKKRQAELLQQAHDELEMRVAQRTRELAESNAALLQEIEQRAAAEKQRIDLLGRLVSSQEFERRRIARDLHDQLGQRLTALRLKIASLKEVTGGNGVLAERIDRLQEIGELLDSEVSFLAWELRPSTLDDLGLVEAVGAYVNEWSRHYEIAAESHTSGLAEARFDRDVETHLYRITQEALNNVAKHAGAGRVSVLLERMGENINLIIEDDGKGFDPEKASVVTESGHGLGLGGMRERAALIGGELEIESARGKGTTIYVRIPTFV